MFSLLGDLANLLGDFVHLVLDCGFAPEFLDPVLDFFIASVPGASTDDIASGEHHNRFDLAHEYPVLRVVTR